LVVETITSWLLIIGAFNILLFTLGIIFLWPRKIWKTPLRDHFQTFVNCYPLILVIIAVVVVHLIEVNFIDQPVSNWVGTNFASSIQIIEDGLVHSISQYQTPILLYFFVFIYLILYPFTLWFSPISFIMTNQRKAMKTFAYGAALIYAISLPFYLFLPITNVYTFYGTGSALNSVIPGVEHFFYTTTTNNNTFPSLHVAMALLVARSVSLTNNKRYTYIAYFSAGAVVLSVIYLAIHWITDVIGGIILAFSVFYLLKHWIKEP